MKLIGITGYKQSGKDTLAREIMYRMAPRFSVRHSFADALKREVADALGISVDEIERNKALFRPILQWWGTDWRRNMFGANYWINKWEERLLKLQELHRPAVIIATDVRFENEAEAIRKHDGIIIRVVRPGVVSDGHASETEMDKIAVNCTILNDEGLDVFANRAAELVEHLSLNKT